MCEGAWPRGVTVTVMGSVTAPGPVSAGGAGPEVGTAKISQERKKMGQGAWGDVVRPQLDLNF